MNKSNYRDLVAWQKARQLAGDIYRATQCFPRNEVFGLTQQTRRAVISVICNIAARHGRRSARETLQFLGIARASAFEVETQIVIATDLAYLDAQASDLLVQHTLDVIRLVNGLIRYYEKEP
jgi:four helix bundle protein